MEELFGLAGDERLSVFRDIVERVLDDAREAPGESFDIVANRVKWPIEILAFRRKVVDEGDKDRAAVRALYNLLESLDEEYGNPEGDGTNSTEGMRAAARRFVEDVVKEYKVWSCEPTGAGILVSREQARETVGE